MSVDVCAVCGMGGYWVVNPEHLEAVTQRVNNERAFADYIECPKGHKLPPKPASAGVRRGQCRVCKSIYDRKRYQEKGSQNGN